MPFLGRRPPTHRMRETVNFERSTLTAGTSGGPINTWATSITAAIALIQTMSADESLRYGRESTKRLYLVVVVGQQDIKQTDRVNWTSNSNKILQIISVPVEGDGETKDITMSLVCEEIIG